MVECAACVLCKLSERPESTWTSEDSTELLCRRSGIDMAACPETECEFFLDIDEPHSYEALNRFIESGEA